MGIDHLKSPTDAKLNANDSVEWIESRKWDAVFCIGYSYRINGQMSFELSRFLVFAKNFDCCDYWITGNKTTNNNNKNTEQIVMYSEKERDNGLWHYKMYCFHFRDILHLFIHIIDIKRLNKLLHRYNHGPL